MLTGVLSLREVVFPSYLVLCPPMGPRVGSLFPGKRPIGETEGFLDELSNSSSSSIENKPWSSSSIVSLRPRLLLLIPLSSPPRRAARESLEEVRGSNEGDLSEILVLCSSRVSIDMLACLGGLPISEPRSPPASEEERSEDGLPVGQEGGVNIIVNLLRGSAQFLWWQKLMQTRWQKILANTLLFTLLRIADIMGLGRENLSECRGRFPKLIGSSKVGGEEPANTPSRVVSPRPRRVLPRKALFGRDEGGKGASSTLRPLAFGEAPKRLSFRGEPKVLLGSSERGCEAWRSLACMVSNDGGAGACPGIASQWHASADTCDNGASTLAKYLQGAFCVMGSISTAIAHHERSVNMSPDCLAYSIVQQSLFFNSRAIDFQPD
ncbi:hypothetical protein KCV03_g311, partial [Aureobasidium melanogenum]